VAIGFEKKMDEGLLSVMVLNSLNQGRDLSRVNRLVGKITCGGIALSLSLQPWLYPLPTFAQTQPDCAAPGRGEYLLLAPTATPEAQALVRSKAPSDATIAICRYFGATVTRIGGFNTESAASVWGQYLIRTTGIKVTIAAPITAAGVTTPTATPNPSPATPVYYNPKILGTGYAVIVNYNNRPEVATQLKQAVNGKVGVVSYGERPYLLANQTDDQTAANAIMKLLSDRGFLAMVVDARQVMLLKAQLP
jgi:hypothetical protein